MGTEQELVLASSSAYRRALLARLGLAFEQVAPEVDESPGEDEAGPALAARLAREKALAVDADNRWVLASDQVAMLGTRQLRKPGTHDAACAQLRDCSGQAVRFCTAVCLRRGDDLRLHTDLTTVYFRALAAAEIERYVAAEQPLDCAGAFKAEGLGITLFERIESDDPTALIGLPLIAVARLLREAGFEVP